MLQRDDSQLTHDADELRAQCGQLYDSWDKILADLEVAHREGETVYSEKIVNRPHSLCRRCREEDRNLQRQQMGRCPGVFLSRRRKRSWDGDRP